MFFFTQSFFIHPGLSLSWHRLVKKVFGLSVRSSLVLTCCSHKWSLVCGLLRGGSSWWWRRRWPMDHAWLCGSVSGSNWFRRNGWWGLGWKSLSCFQTGMSLRISTSMAISTCTWSRQLCWKPMSGRVQVSGLWSVKLQQRRLRRWQAATRRSSCPTVSFCRPALRGPHCCQELLVAGWTFAKGPDRCSPCRDCWGVVGMWSATTPMFSWPMMLWVCRLWQTLHQSKAGGLLWMGCTTSSWLTLPLVAPWKQSVGTSVGWTRTVSIPTTWIWQSLMKAWFIKKSNCQEKYPPKICLVFFKIPKNKPKSLDFVSVSGYWFLLFFLGSAAGARTLVIAYHQYDGMTPRSAVMTTDANGDPLQTLALWFQKPPSTGGRRMQAQLENPSCFFFKLDNFRGIHCVSCMFFINPVTKDIFHLGFFPPWLAGSSRGPMLWGVWGCQSICFEPANSWILDSWHSRTPKVSKPHTSWRTSAGCTHPTRRSWSRPTWQPAMGLELTRFPSLSPSTLHWWLQVHF